VADAGPKSGDVITEVNGEPVLRSGSLSPDRPFRPGRAGQPRLARLRRCTLEATRRRQEDAEKKVADAGASAESASRPHAAPPTLTRSASRSTPARRRGCRRWRAARLDRGRRRAARDNGKTVQSLEQVKGVLAGKPKAWRCSSSATARRSSCR
jgi:serine protease Do